MGRRFDYFCHEMRLYAGRRTLTIGKSRAGAWAPASLVPVREGASDACAGWLGLRHDPRGVGASRCGGGGTVECCDEQTLLARLAVDASGVILLAVRRTAPQTSIALAEVVLATYPGVVLVVYAEPGTLDAAHCMQLVTGHPLYILDGRLVGVLAFVHVSGQYQQAHTDGFEQFTAPGTTTLNLFQVE